MNLPIDKVRLKCLSKLMILGKILVGTTDYGRTGLASCELRRTEAKNGVSVTLVYKFVEIDD